MDIFSMREPYKKVFPDGIQKNDTVYDNNCFFCNSEIAGITKIQALRGLNLIFL